MADIAPKPFYKQPSWWAHALLVIAHVAVAIAVKNPSSQQSAGRILDAADKIGGSIE